MYSCILFVCSLPIILINLSNITKILQSIKTSSLHHYSKIEWLYSHILIYNLPSIWLYFLLLILIKPILPLNLLLYYFCLPFSKAWPLLLTTINLLISSFLSSPLNQWLNVLLFWSESSVGIEDHLPHCLPKAFLFSLVGISTIFTLILNLIKIAYFLLSLSIFTFSCFILNKIEKIKIFDGYWNDT